MQHDSIHTVSAGAAVAAVAGTAPWSAYRLTTPRDDGDVGRIGAPVRPTPIWPS